MVVENKYPAVVKIASVLLILALTIYGMLVLRTVLVPLAFSMLFAMLLYPLCQRLERWKFSRLWAIIVCLLVMVAVLGLLLNFIYSQIMNFAEELPQMAGRANELLEQVQVWVEKTFKVRKSTQIPMLKNSVTEWARTHSAFFTSTLSATTSTLGTISLLPILIFFFLLYRDFFRKFFYMVFKDTATQKVDHVLSKIQQSVQNYITGLGLVILIVAVLNITGLLILGIDYAFFFGALGALLTIIPYVGIFIGALLPSLMSLVTKDSAWYAVGVAGIFFFVQILEGNFITPNVVGSKVSINPLVAIVGLILGGMLWGAPGMILAIPFLAVIKVIFDSVEGLQPYGFVLGDSEEVQAENKDLVDTISEGIKKKVTQNPAHGDKR
jgi:predicted PurR-regulated permease PerM